MRIRTITYSFSQDVSPTESETIGVSVELEGEDNPARALAIAREWVTGKLTLYRTEPDEDEDPDYVPF